MVYFILLLFIPPVLLFLYYAGFIAMTRLKIKQVDNDMKTHFLRLFWGFIVFAVIAIFILLIRWLFFQKS